MESLVAILAKTFKRAHSTATVPCMRVAVVALFPFIDDTITAHLKRAWEKSSSNVWCGQSAVNVVWTLC